MAPLGVHFRLPQTTIIPHGLASLKTVNQGHGRQVERDACGSLKITLCTSKMHVTTFGHLGVAHTGQYPSSCMVIGRFEALPEDTLWDDRGRRWCDFEDRPLSTPQMRREDL